MSTNILKRNTREKILESGLALFSKKGYLGATTREIAKKAGVAELTVFRQFASKERLFEEVVKTYSFLPALRGLLPELKDLDYETALSVIASKYLERLSERKDLIRIMQSELHLYPAKVKVIHHSFIDEIIKTLASYFSDLQAKGLLRDFDPELGARAFLGMFFSYFNMREFMGKERSGPDTEKVIRAYVEIFLRGTHK